MTIAAITPEQAADLDRDSDKLRDLAMLPLYGALNRYGLSDGALIGGIIYFLASAACKAQVELCEVSEFNEQREKWLTAAAACFDECAARETQKRQQKPH